MESISVGLNKKGEQIVTIKVHTKRADGSDKTRTFKYNAAKDKFKKGQKKNGFGSWLKNKIGNKIG